MRRRYGKLKNLRLLLLSFVKELKELLFYITYKRISGIHYICAALKGDNGNVYLSVTRDKNYRENIIDNTRSVQG